MNFNLEKSIEILERTPDTLSSLLNGLSEFWTTPNEGPDTWSSFDVMGHYVHAEKTNWIQRIEIILNGNGQGSFQAFDRIAQFENCKGKSVVQLLEEFKLLRSKNIAILKEMQITETELNKMGIHPEFGHVSLKQLISTWLVHDLDHFYQITRVIAKQYTEDVGPWVQYLRILRN